MDFVAFGLILDDIVFPDGRTAMGVLGGGGPQAAFGMRLWAEQVGLAAGVGHDLPDAARAWLAESGIDTAGLRFGDAPTPRAWQVTEADGRRTHLWRTDTALVWPQLRRSLDLLPPAYQRARGYHFGIHPEEPDLEFVSQLRPRGGLVSVETFRAAAQPPEAEALHALVRGPHIFSATLAEAQSLVGPGTPRSVARRLVEHGAWIVAVRLGAEGSLVMEGQTARMAHIPALPGRVVNPVGAGNAYSGGFLAGWTETHDVVMAGLYGAVAASFVVEQVRLPVVSENVRQEARKRLAAAREQGVLL